MATATYRDFLPEVLPFVRDCSEVAALAAIRQACGYFCRHALVWRYETDPISVEADTADYTLDLPAGTSVAVVLNVWFEARLLPPAGVDELAARFGADWRVQRGAPAVYTHVTETGEIRLVPCPDVSSAGAVKVLLACTPTKKATTVDSLVLDRYAEVIADGARARLHDTPNQPYYDPNKAAQLRIRFHAGTMQAARDAQRSFTRAPGRVTPRRFA